MSFFKKFKRKGKQSPEVGYRPSEGSVANSSSTATGSSSLGAPIASAVTASTAAPQGSQTIMISGGNFTDVGRDVINKTTNIQNNYVVEDAPDTKLFATLNPVAAAHDCQAVNSKVSKCLEGTRRQLLLDIEAWINTRNSAPVFILDGIAGIGKSTVAKTICARANADRRLAASWFFSRDEQDRKSSRGFIATLAFQLASYHPLLREHITRALKDHPDILQKTIRAQFTTLIQEPLQIALKDSEGTHTISIDAIDECDIAEATEILSILLSAIPQHPSLRLLVTCRPERPFRLLLDRYRASHVFHLHDIEASVVESDIRLYIDHFLSAEQIDEALPDLFPPPWRASDKEKEALVQMAGKLFIVASTAVTFILDPQRLDPESQIQQLLEGKSGAGLASSPMDRLYTQILRAAVPTPVGDWFDDYQLIVGSIVVTVDVLSTQSLASLLNIKPNRIVRTLSHLHSLLSPTNNSDAYRIHHTSFPDFVTDASRCSIDPRFVVDISVRHFHLARHCVQLMLKQLKQNICDLPADEWDTARIELSSTAALRIPSELAYACSNWISHLDESHILFTDSDELYSEIMAFINEHLLSWLEVVAWVGKYDTAWDQVKRLLKTVTLLWGTESPSSGRFRVVDILQDFLRFISLHPSLPCSYPMHIYLSSLPFVPHSSIVNQLYSKQLPKHSAHAVSGIKPEWPPFSMVLNIRGIEHLTFSSCSKLLATLDKPATGVMRIHNVETGALLRECLLEGVRSHWFSMHSISFSPRGRYIAWAVDAQVAVWNVSTGDLVGMFTPPNDFAFTVTAIAFTQDEEAIVAGSNDGTALLWQLDGDEMPAMPALGSGDRRWGHKCYCGPGKHKSDCCAQRVYDIVAFSGAQTLTLITRSDIQFWCYSTYSLSHRGVRRTFSNRGNMEKSFKGPVALSLDKELCAFECGATEESHVIKVYSTTKAICLATLFGHTNVVTALAFSHPSQQLCSATSGMAAWLWDITTGAHLITVTTPGQGPLTNAVFSCSINQFVFEWCYYEWSQLIRLRSDEPSECIPLGPKLDELTVSDKTRYSPDGSMVAFQCRGTTEICNVESLMQASAQDMTSGQCNEMVHFGYSSTGDHITITRQPSRYQAEPTRFEYKATSVNQTTKNATSFEFSGLIQDISPDWKRVAVSRGTNVSIVNLHSGLVEATLASYDGPTRFEYTAQHLHAWFSTSSNIAYVWRDRSVYAVELSPDSSLHGYQQSKKSSRTPTFSKYWDFPPNDFPIELWRNRSMSLTAPLHFMNWSSAWALQNDGTTWVSAPLPERPICSELPVYSPNGKVAVTLGKCASSYPYDAGSITSLQMRAVPGYQELWTFHEPAFIAQNSPTFIFPPSCPDILVAHTRKGITSWDTSTLTNLGHHQFLPSTACLHVHSCSATNFLCLVEFQTSFLGLMVVQLRGESFQAKTQVLCWFPPYLELMGEHGFQVNPCRPHIIALSGKYCIVEVDISHCPLPFYL